MAAHTETSVAPLWQQRITHSTCSFVTCADHLVLFQSLYQRTNRTRGSKILRCFPHCCPHHLDRNFCGSPLLIRVEDSKSLLSLELLVFARFRLVNSVDFGVGDCIAASDILSSIQSEQNPNGEWITADEQISLAQTHSRSFLLNPRARWFYSWESGVAKAHRLQEHALRVLVLAPM
ncbi:hypothetical protein Poli38472_010969 [Pythium oligandrum]|uniref:Uncharacterized protein n=1 Tax=Pythium oligandrum TaxID=41045 RepID=A0A8K1FGQ2_PYTOL|nr:hypothetical protein Poli38472_010969 [Pythium oligandrum]|eukprot:TMW61906.1 hypothetical protein Poli38472_010969 [Pythium oligandrum]